MNIRLLGNETIHGAAPRPHGGPKGTLCGNHRGRRMGALKFIGKIRAYADYRPELIETTAPVTCRKCLGFMRGQ